MLDVLRHPHTVESLAEIARMSRSSFAGRFSTAYGHGPMELLWKLHMQLASNLLIENDLPVKRIAQLAGFTSRSAFSRTFKSSVGRSPQSYRSEQV